MNRSVALIYPYFLTDSQEHMLYQPLGIASLSGQIMQRGIEARQYDCTFSRFEDIVEKVTAQQPGIVGIYAMISMSANAIRLAAALKQRLPEALFVSGGPLPTLYPERFARHFDAVFCGEADVAFPEFCRAYLGKRGRGDLEKTAASGNYPGLYLALENRIISSPAINYTEAVLDRLPLPDRRGVDYGIYQRLWQEKAGARPASIMLTRGCPFSCDFCSKPVFGTAFRKRDMDCVMAEVADIKAMGYDRLWIGDDSFTLDLNYLRAFCNAMIKNRMNMTWTCLSRVSGVGEDAANLMQRAGCVKVYLGLESGSDETLKLMKKNTTVAEGISAVKMFDKCGLKAAGFFMVGYPGETLLNMEKTFSLPLELPLDEISFTVPFPLPGTGLYKRALGVDREDDWDVENEVKFVFDSEFDREYIKKRIAETVRTFKAARKTIVRA